MPAAAVHYRVSLEQPHGHLIRVEATFPSPEASGAGRAVGLTVRLPVWTPGSYLVREYARHFQDLRAVDAEGRALAVTRPDKSSFHVARPGSGSGPVTLSYRVYANELTVRTSHFDGSHAYFNGATLFPTADELREGEHRVTVRAPEGWRTACALPVDGESFVARSFDELVDSPFEVGPHRPIELRAAGVTHEAVIWGDTLPDEARFREEVARVCEACVGVFGELPELPAERYLFLIYLSEKGRGGLEHAASTALLFPRPALQTVRGWEDFLTLVAHEYFHLWNVKRIKPKAFVPFDYSREGYTELLWAFEGMTSYYDNLLVRRAGLMSAPRYLGRLGESITALHGTPGRKVQTLAEASRLTWIKQYRPDENSNNSAISYYLKGEIVAPLLDLEIRRATSDARSLDDVMRLLWKRYGDGSGVPEEGVEAAAAEVAGRELKGFFDRSIRSTEELDYGPFTHVGLQLLSRMRESASDKGGSPPRLLKSLDPRDARPKGWLGLSFRGGGLVSSVLSGSPAAQAGIYPDDEVLALDGYRVDGAALLNRCEERRPGETVELTLFRRESLMRIPVALGARPPDAFYLTRVEAPTTQQKAAYRGWLGADWDELSQE